MSGIGAVLFFGRVVTRATLLKLTKVIVIMSMQEAEKGPNEYTLRNLIISKPNLDGALVLGIAVLFSFSLSLWGITTGLSKERPNLKALKLFNWSVVFSVLVSTVGQLPEYGLS
jgi:hypothetical protein